MGQEVKKRIAADVIDAVYYSICVDSTPDVSHSDQLAFCIRYVKDGKINERFIAFIPIEGHTSEYLFGVVSKFLEENKIDIKNCRGQSYDNANNMAGISGGLQSLIREKSESAFFVPCGAHTLNLVGVNTVSKNVIATNFFDLIEKVYSFFVHSPYRWNKLKEQITEKGEYMLKKASGTRWSARNDAINALHSCYLKVLTVLKSFTTEASFTEENKALVKGLIAKLCQFQNIFALVLWKSVLSKFNIVSKVLQKENLTISVTKKLYDSLVTDLENKSFENIFDEALKMFRSIPSDITVDIMNTRLMSHALNPENENDKQKIKDSFFEPVINALLSNLKRRTSAFEVLDSQYSFLVNLGSMSDADIAKSCKNIVSKYPKDINEEQLITECEVAKNYFTFDKLNHENMHKTMFNDNLCSAFPNMDILLRMYLCMFVTNVLDERSFSKLKLIKNVLRNTISNDRLTDLSILGIEYEMLDELNFNEIIDKFVEFKCRKIKI